ncbi:MAG: succinylglutamate desuccinylase/aspartoacylase family protein [Nitrospirae bacterium]|nr:succinylglutamate desuccinylase/aspartoacylase family protein [Nitrospirota bacterium]
MKVKCMMVRLSWCFLVLVAVALFPVGECFGKTEHVVYFEGTDYELNVYKIYGKEPGKTLLIIGGIQGDESGGYLSADLYADLTLKKGNLLLVPRANFLSIIKHKRVINNDMNRRFNYINSKEYYEDKIVEILKSLIDKSDYLLNLHEGSGFFSEKYESELVNPMRFGQSIIADAEVFKTKDGKVIRLGQMARDVAKAVNLNVREPRHRFRFNNHRTFESDTMHPEQRKSATFYAVSQHNIPAFGIEASKEIKDVEKKVGYHTMVINAFMDKFGIVPETPGIVMEKPRLNYLVVAVNGVEQILHNEQTLPVRKGDRIKISNIVANYKRGLSVSLVGLGTDNDLNKDFVVDNPVNAIVLKDGYKCGEAHFKVVSKVQQSPQATSANGAEPILRYLVIENNGVRYVLKNEEHLSLVKGDVMKILDVVFDGQSPENVTVNLLGYIGNKRKSTTEDRGYPINTAKDLIQKYSKDKGIQNYTIEVVQGKNLIGNVYLDVSEPRMDYIVLMQNKGGKRWYADGDVVMMTQNDMLELIDVKTNVNSNAGVKVYVKGLQSTDSKHLEKSLSLGEVIRSGEYPMKKGSQFQIVVSREGIVLGKATVKVNEQVASWGIAR